MTHFLIAPERKTVGTLVMLPEYIHFQVPAAAEANHASPARGSARLLGEYQGQLQLLIRLSSRQGSDS
ncbi:hypothetical protein CFN16_20730 [Pseudomonas fluorescens]|uniref:Uncharacterized protein n=1 Tax=Pseudomonas fluorescens TaxID=294 RepID=A0A345V158_PSEFL|nr:hypothetical protein CFN16_20730 [Pseudomonas fluorescens]